MATLSKVQADENRAYHREYMRKRRATPEGAAENKKNTRKYYRGLLGNPDTWPRISILGLRARAKRLNISFNLTPEDIIIPLVCPVLNVPFVFLGGVNHPHGPSVDRVVPALGYVKGNVRVITRQANTMKQDCVDPEVFRRMAAYIEESLKDRIE